MLGKTQTKWKIPKTFQLLSFTDLTLIQMKLNAYISNA